MARAELFAAALDQLPWGLYQADFALQLVAPRACDDDNPPRLASLWPAAAVPVVAALLERELSTAVARATDASSVFDTVQAAPCLELLRLQYTYARTKDGSASRELRESAEGLLDACNDDAVRFEWAYLALADAAESSAELEKAQKRNEQLIERLGDRGRAVAWELVFVALTSPEAQRAQYLLLRHDANALDLPWLAQKAYRLAFDNAWQTSAEAVTELAVQLPVLQQESRKIGSKDDRGRQVWASTQAQVAWLRKGPVGVGADPATVPRPVRRAQGLRSLQGIVRYIDGTPAAHAEVVVSEVPMLSDGLRLAPWYWDDTAWRTRADAQGRYAFDDVPASAWVAAQITGADRMPGPAPAVHKPATYVDLMGWHMSDDELGRLTPLARNLGERYAATSARHDLRIAPVYAVEGKVPGPAMRAQLAPVDGQGMVQLMAPVDRDGRVRFTGVPAGRYVAFVSKHLADRGASVDVEVGKTTPLIEFSERRGRTGYALVRSSTFATLAWSRTSVISGKVRGVGEMRSYAELASIPMQYGIVGGVAKSKRKGAFPAIAAVWREGDLVIEFEDLPHADVWVCATGIYGDVNDEAYMKIMANHIKELPYVCRALKAEQTSVVLEVPPHPKWEK